jgi:F0F1-type ATP synthase assembly protein I
MKEDGKPGSEPTSLWVEAGRHMGYGLNWALSTLLFLLVGWWLDTKLGTTPILLILGAFVGAGAGFYSLYFHVVVEPRKQREEEDH